MNKNKYIFNLIFLLMIIVFLLIIFPTVDADSITIQPGPSDGKDAFIYQKYENSNYGNSIRLRVGCYDNNWDYVSFIQFNLDLYLPQNTIINSASLELYCDNTWGNAQYIDAYELSRNWDEDSVKWSNYWPVYYYSSPSDRVRVSTEDKWYSWDVTEHVEDWFYGIRPNNGFFMWHTSMNDEDQALFRSSEYSDISKRPKLIISYSLPEPPEPDVYEIECPSNINLGETATIKINGRNNGAEADEGFVSISFPDLTGADENHPSNIQITEERLEYDYIIWSGETMGSNYGGGTITALYPTAVGENEPWGSGDDNEYIKVNVKPVQAGSFRVFFKMTASDSDGNWYGSPTSSQSSTKDQQHEYVYVRTINVIEPDPPEPDVISITCPSTINLGETATIRVDGEIKNNDAYEGYLSMSFPDLIGVTNENHPSHLGIIAENVEDDFIIWSGETMGSNYGGGNSITAQYPTAFGVNSPWNENDDEYIGVNVRPVEPGPFKIFFKMTASDTENNWYGSPKEDGSETSQKDQQHEYVYVRTINVIPPEPNVQFISCESEIYLGETATINIRGKNAGGTSFGTLSVSFPDMPDDDAADHVWFSSGNDFNSQHRVIRLPGDPEGLHHDYGSIDTIPVNYVHLEGFDENWNENEGWKDLKVSFQPTQPGDFRIFYKTTMGPLDGGVGTWFGDPAEDGLEPGSEIDQQNEYVFVHTITVKPDIIVEGTISFLHEDNIKIFCRNVSIEIFDDDGLFGDDDILNVEPIFTDNNGYFEAEVNNIDEDGTLNDIYLVISAENNYVQVKNDIPIIDFLYNYQTDTREESFGIPINFEVTIDDDSAGAWFIHNIITSSYFYMKQRLGDNFSMIQQVVEWPNYPYFWFIWNDNGKAYYDPDDREIEINDSATWDYNILQHEYGHSIMHNHFEYPELLSGSSETIPQPHFPVNESNYQYAMTEGWAEFMQCYIGNNPVDLYHGDKYTSNIENNFWFDYNDTHDMDGNIVEGSIASILWDIHDNPENDDDGISDQMQKIWTIMKLYKPIGMNDPINGDGINDFWDAWFAEGYQNHSEMNAIYWNYGINNNNEPILTIDSLDENFYFDNIQLSGTCGDNDGLIYVDNYASECLKVEYSTDSINWKTAVDNGFVINQDNWEFVWDSYSGNDGTDWDINGYEESVMIRIKIRDGYHWDQVMMPMEWSDWIFTGPFSVDNQEPETPIISSDHLQGEISDISDISFWWNDVYDGGSGIDGYAYELTHNPNTIPNGIDLEEYETSISFNDLNDGTWYFHLVAIDDLGNVGETAHYGPIIIFTGEPNPDNNPPVADIGGPYYGFEGDAILLDASGSYDVDGDDLFYRWDFNNDGVWDIGLSNDAEMQYSWNDDYNGLVVIEVFDGFEYHSTSAIVEIENVNPIVNIGVYTNIYQGEPVEFTGSFTDSGLDDTHDILWDFGDGHIETNTLTSTHTYDEPGNYLVTLTITDDDGGSDSDTTYIEVNIRYSLIITKIVDWNETINIDIEKTFTIEVSNEVHNYYSSHTVDYDGETIVLNDLKGGHYTVTEQDPGGGWTTSGTGEYTLNLDETSTYVEIINTYHPGCIELTKIVDWNETINIDIEKTFTIEVSGPNDYFFTHTVDYDGETFMLDKLMGGQYTISEQDPDEGWTSTGLGIYENNLNVDTNYVEIINTYHPGCIQISKIVDWTNSASPDSSKTFEIVIGGPHDYSSNVIVDWDGEMVLIPNLHLGQYSISEVDPGENWIIDGNDILLDISSEESITSHVITNTFIDSSSQEDLNCILFSSNRSGNWDIWKYDIDNDQFTQLTYHEAADIAPHASPDGTKIVFISGRTGYPQPWIMNLETGEKNQLFDVLTLPIPQDYPIQVRFIKWHPSGEYIVAQINRREGPPSDWAGMFRCDPDGNNVMEFLEMGPSIKGKWEISSDGLHLAYCRENSNYNAYSLKITIGTIVDGIIDPLSLTNIPSTIDGQRDYDVNWYSNDEKIIWVKNKQPWNIFTADSDGTNWQQLTFYTGNDGARRPEVSNDNTQVVYTRWKEGVNLGGFGWWGIDTGDIYKMNTDGSEQDILIGNDGHLYQCPVWLQKDLPDLSIESSDIQFSTDNPQVGESIYINATIHNIGNTSIDDSWQLTYASEQDYIPQWSHDDSKIAFTSKRNNNQDIWLMNSDGSNQHQLTDELISGSSITWNPDDLKVYYGWSPFNGDGEIAVIDADGSNQQHLTNNPGLNTQSFDLSENGAYFTFVRGAEFNGYSNELFIAESDLTSEVKLTNAGPAPHNPRFSPDGEWIAYMANYYGSRSDIELIRADNTERTIIINNNYANGCPEWFNQNQLIYRSNKDGYNNLYLLDINTFEEVKLTNNTYYCNSPHPSSTGNRIIYSSDESGNSDIFMINCTCSSIVKVYDGDPNAGGILIGEDTISIWVDMPEEISIEWTPQDQGNHEIYVVITDLLPGDKNYSNNIASKSIYV